MDFDFNTPPKQKLVSMSSHTAELLHPSWEIRRKFYNEVLIPSGHASHAFYMSEEYIEALQKDPKVFQALLKMIL